MFATAIVAIFIGVPLEVGRRSRRFARLAAYHSNVALEHFGTLMASGGEPPPLRDVPAPRLGPVRYRHRVKALLNYHCVLTEKYSSAARYPWLPDEPDPPEPQ
jgi:hypothetical protein